MNHLRIGQQFAQPSTAVQTESRRAFAPHLKPAQDSEPTLFPHPTLTFSPRTMANGSVTEAVLGPVPLATATLAMMRQSQLSVPAKLLRRHAGGAEILIELPGCRTPESMTESVMGATQATLAWLSEANGYESSKPHLPSSLEVQIRDAISALGWQLVNSAAGHYTVTPTIGGLSRRLLIDPSPTGHLRISLPPRAVRIENWQCTRAMILFALEANSRLRLARLTVTPAGNTTARVTYEQVILAEEPLDGWLAKAARTLLIAAEATERSVRALANAAVASTYLRGFELKTAALGTLGRSCEDYATDCSQR